MKIIRGSDLSYVPASHEDPKNPGSLKKILVGKDDVQAGRLQMVNWSLLPVGKSFTSHYHEDLEEIFIIAQGSAEITAGKEKAVLQKGDCICIPPRTPHAMKNIGTVDVEFLAIGIASGTGGKTVLV